MRISDWSSDVCSSDLLGRELLEANRRGQARRAAADDHHVICHRFPFDRVLAHASPRGYGMFRVFILPAPAGAGEPKTVGHGKSVYVRLALGCCHIINKTITTQTDTTHDIPQST